ncbi:PRD domain-containing protein [Pediococcus ethanolidurans]|uniref:sigma 54-interacting transcriptional regulator n=1 Tax=Pediococcus ethanolidurans TaxID=319653 RepID=UPI00295388BE|nr:sigma 54-interacting transcriptional regulator [Pediococcus ethanolidurans]MDV7720209.1 PRD domain-containing protein [Pediococcus ethanolidurans]
MLAKQKVLEELQTLTENGSWVSAEDIAKVLGISRQNVSHYCNQLHNEREIQRKPGRPVLWKTIQKSTQYRKLNIRQKSLGPFEQIIGHDGSLHEVILKCISAIEYPGGLNILLQGPSGVGKSFIAHKIFDYARVQKVVREDAPFMVLNCADYADNPELLSATLFGYKQGAFTGAVKNQSGLLESADGGYLFLDEVHRLSSENQEKLFLFMDSGCFRPIGDNSKWQHAKVRFIFATTEDINKFFLDTFTRRIEVSVKLPAFFERPMNERLALIQSFFVDEAQNLHRDIKVSGQAIAVLAGARSTGNVGQIRGKIKLACADVFSQTNSTTLFVGEDAISSNFKISSIDPENEIEPLLIRWQASKVMAVKAPPNLLILSNLVDHVLRRTPANRLGTLAQQVIKQLRIQMPLSEIQRSWSKAYIKRWQKIVVRKYGVTQAQLLGVPIGEVAVQNIQAPDQTTKALKIFGNQFPRSMYIASRYINSLDGVTQTAKAFLKLLIAITLSDLVQEHMPLKGLLIAHGEHTASSIQAVVNQLCGNYIFEAIDMPIESGVEQIIRRVRQFINNEVQSNGLVLLVDMGSLNQLYTQLKNDLKGELLVIDNVTTAVALDIGLKMQSHVAFDRIAEDAQTNYRINIQYFEGFAQKSNIIISCMSGLGISKQLSQIFSKYFNGSNLDIFTPDYRTLRKLIDQNNEDYFKKTKLVITTSALPHTFSIPNINIYDILNPKGSSRLEKLLENEITQGQFHELMQELVRFFSLEGVADKLNVLNPKMVISEVETVVSKYENIYKLDLSGTVKLNLYMHIALMMERLFIARTETDDEGVRELQSEVAEFFLVSHSIFQPMEIKYGFKVNDYELSLLYEILGPYIRK